MVLIVVSGCSPRVGLAVHPPPGQIDNVASALLDSSVSRIDFGKLTRGGHRETAVWLSNNGPRPIAVAEVRTSCECFQVTLEKKIIAPGERIRAVVKVDFAHDPKFVGQLGLQTEGVATTEKTPAFVIQVDVKVE